MCLCLCVTNTYHLVLFDVGAKRVPASVGLGSLLAQMQTRQVGEVLVGSFASLCR